MKGKLPFFHYQTKIQLYSFSVQTAKWIGDCLIYTTPNRLCYFIGTETYTISPFDRFVSLSLSLLYIY